MPLANVRSVEVLIKTESESTGTVRKASEDTTACCPYCCLCCCPTCCGNKYQGSEEVAKKTTNQRYVEINYEGAAWKDKRVLRIHMRQEEPMKNVLRWLSALQSHAEASGDGERPPVEKSKL